MLSVDDLSRDKVNFRIKEYMSRMGSQVSFHKSHCPNYRLFVASMTTKENPFAIKIERVDSMLGTNKVDMSEPLVINDDIDSISAHSVRVADNRSSK